MNADRNVNEQVRQLLGELDAADADAVLPLLLSLRSMADGEAPPPSAELAALLSDNGVPSAALLVRRRHQALVFSLALIGALVALSLIHI